MYIDNNHAFRTRSMRYTIEISHYIEHLYNIASQTYLHVVQ